MSGKWVTRSSRYLIERWWMNLRQDQVTLPSGIELDEYHVLEVPEWVGVICVVDHPTRGSGVLFVRQYRHAASRFMYELPAGAVDTGETIVEAAARELLEETGYAVAQFDALPALYSDPSRVTGQGHILLGRGPRQVASPAPDRTEDLTSVVVPFEEVGALIASGELAHATHVAGLLLAASRGDIAPIAIPRP